MREITKKERFNDKVLSRFNLYNSIFSTLPYESIANTGVMLPLFEAECVKGYEKNLNPSQIVENFFNLYMNQTDESEKISSCFVLFSTSSDKLYCLMPLKMLHFLKLII